MVLQMKGCLWCRFKRSRCEKLGAKGGRRRRGRGSRNAGARENSCEFCGREHDLAKCENCPGYGKSYNKCGKKNYFANMCFGHVPKPRYRSRLVNCFKYELPDEVFGVAEISAVTLYDSQLVTLKLEFGNYWPADQLLFKRFRRVFADGVGVLAGEYHMVLDESVRPVQQPPRRVSFAIRERLRETLEYFEKREIIARVTTPTP